jgi:UDP-glucose 4-epimerase
MNYKIDRVMVTGGAGFIGSHITDLLLDSGYSVIVVDNLSRGKKENLNPQAKFYQVDIRDQKIAEILEKEKPQAIIHQAAQINVRESLEDPINDAENNIIGSLNLVKSAIESKVKKFIFSSSGGAVYGDPEKIPCSEETTIQPLCPYGTGKRSFELYLTALSKLNNLDYIILRYSNVYGPRQDPKGEAGVVSIFIDRLLANKIPLINGDGRQTRDFVYVKDVARANLAGLKKKPRNHIFNIGTGCQSSILEIYQQIRKILKSKIKAKYQPAVPGEVRHTYLDISRAQAELAWQPEHDLKKGLRKTVNWQKDKNS